MAQKIHPGFARSADDSRCPILSHHGQLLVCIAADPTERLRDLARRVELTERAVSRILADLLDAGLVSKTRVGRRNHYTLHAAVPLRMPDGLHTSVTIAMVLALLAEFRVGQRPPQEGTP